MREIGGANSVTILTKHPQISKPRLYDRTINNGQRMRQNFLYKQEQFAMSDSDQDEKKPGVPSWQLETKPAESEEPREPAPESPSRDTVIEQAKKFLEEDEVRSASTDKKISFLEGKGLKSEEITELLGVSRNQEATALPQVSRYHSLRTMLTSL